LGEFCDGMVGTGVVGKSNIFAGKDIFEDRDMRAVKYKRNWLVVMWTMMQRGARTRWLRR